MEVKNHEVVLRGKNLGGGGKISPPLRSCTKAMIPFPAARGCFVKQVCKTSLMYLHKFIYKKTYVCALRLGKR